jgi:hypothetical protein
MRSRGCRRKKCRLALPQTGKRLSNHYACRRSRRAKRPAHRPSSALGAAEPLRRYPWVWSARVTVLPRARTDGVPFAGDASALSSVLPRAVPTRRARSPSWSSRSWPPWRRSSSWAHCSTRGRRAQSLGARRALEGGAQLRGRLFGLGVARVLVPRPKEATKAVAFAAGHDVDMNVRDALAHAVV